MCTKRHGIFCRGSRLLHTDRKSGGGCKPPALPSPGVENPWKGARQDSSPPPEVPKFCFLGASSPRWLLGTSEKMVFGLTDPLAGNSSKNLLWRFGPPLVDGATRKKFSGASESLKVRGKYLPKFKTMHNFSSLSSASMRPSCPTHPG